MALHGYEIVTAGSLLLSILLGSTSALLSKLNAL